MFCIEYEILADEKNRLTSLKEIEEFESDFNTIMGQIHLKFDNEVLSDAASALKQYLENGLYADVLKSRMGVAVGFVDGNLEILYSN